jgi:hypothetical protein
MGSRLYQLHIWVREEDYRTLKQLAADDDESLGRLVRRQLRSLIRNRRSRLVTAEAIAEPVAIAPVRRR